MATTSNHNLQYPENDDQISAYPTTAAITAAIVDQALPIKGGSVGQVLAKSDDADYKYIWKDAPTGGDGGGDSYPGISQDVPNDLELRGDGLYVSPAWLNADDPDDRALAAAATAPVQLYGVGRPDQQYGALGTLSATATTTTATLTYADAGDGLAAPEGSTFHCTDSQGGNNFGARQWSKGPSGWYVTDGLWFAWDYIAGIDHSINCYVAIQFIGNGQVQIYSHINTSLHDGQPRYTEKPPTFMGAAEAYVRYTTLETTARQTFSAAYVSFVAGRCTYVGAPTGGGWETGTAVTTLLGNAWPDTDAGWNTGPTPARTLEELKELIEAIEAAGEPYPPNYQSLKDELAALHNQTGTGDIQ